MNTEQKLTGFPSIDKPWLKYYTEEALNAKLPECTIYEYLWENNKNHLNDIALVFGDKKITYKEVFENIEKTAYAFLNAGVKSGDIVTVCIPNTPETVYIFYALNRISATCEFLDPRASQIVMEEHLKLSQSKLLITIAECFPVFQNIRKTTDISKIVIINVVESFAAFKCESLPQNTFAFQEFMHNCKIEEKSNFSAKYPVCILHTGGTTGIPKGVVLENQQFNFLCTQYIQLNIFKRGYTLLSLMPPFVSFGLIANLHIPLSLGVTLIFIPEYAPEKIIEQIDLYKPNCIPASPAHWEIIYNSEKIKSMDLSYVKFGFIGGDTLNAKIEEGLNLIFKKTNPDFRIIKGYGMTESSTAVTVSFNEQVNEILSVGCPLPQVNVSTFDEEENELHYNQIGEICVQSGGIMTGYYKNKVATNEMIRTHKNRQVWLHTGDMGCMTEEGILFIKGRLKRIIIRYDGIKIYPVEIETKINECDYVKNCAVVGSQDPEHIQGKIPVAFIVLNDNIKQEDIFDDLNCFCVENIIDYAVPQKYYFVEALPKTKSGKIDFVHLEKEAEKLQ